MAVEFKHFQPRTYADEKDWKSEAATSAGVLACLEAAGAEKCEDLQVFLAEIVWAVVRGELTAAHAVELLAKSPVATREPLQRLFADVLWVVGFAATEAPTNREPREELCNLSGLLEGAQVMPRKLLAMGLEMEAVPPVVCQVAQLKKKHNQAKTKARYTITRFNLLREHTEGYAKLLFLLDRLASLDFEPRASPKELVESEDVLASDIVRLAGFGHLCPNRMLSMALDIFELRLLEADPCPLAKPLQGLLKRFPLKRLTEVTIFQLLAHAPPAGGREAVRGVTPPLPAPPSRPSQFLAVAALIQADLVDLTVLWPYLDPADSLLKQTHADMMEKYDNEVASVTKVDLGSTGSTGKGSDSFNRAYQQVNQAEHQKFRLAAALISVNSWRVAHRVLMRLNALCKPCLNHQVRSALCDLLKWLIWPLVQPPPRPGQKVRPTVETTYGGTRRFGLGLEAMDAAHAAEGKATVGANGSSDVSGRGAVPLALRPSTDFEQLLPQVRLVLEHLEYFIHADVHLLTWLWKFVLLYLRQKGKPESGHVVLDNEMVAVVYRHLLPAASLVPNNPFLSNLMWSVMKELSVFQRFLIYSCWETQYDSFLLKLAYEKTKSSTKQILKRVVANADRRDLIAHQSHFHICKLCHSNPIPCIEIMLKDVEIGFNVNMIQPYVECTNKCPEMTADILAYVLARICAKPSTPTRAYLNQADATLSPWLVNLGEFVGRFFKKHPQTDLVGLLTIITKRINGDGQEGALDKISYKGESLIRVILENLIEYMGGMQSVTDMTSEQLNCLAGGHRLKTESIAYGKKEDTVRKERARQALVSAFIELDLVPVLWYSLSQQRHLFLSEEFSEEHSSSGGLKLLGLLFDGNHECFLKLVEFLAQSCTREKFASLLPPLQQVFSMFEPALAFLAIRPGLPPFGRPSNGAASVVAASKDQSKDKESAASGKEEAGKEAAPAGNDESAAGKEAAPAAAPATEEIEVVAPIPEPEAIVELDRVVRLFLPKNFETEGLSVQFFLTFWRLSLQDVFMPSEGYERAAAQIQVDIKQLEVQKKQMERGRDESHTREYKALKKETARLQDFHTKLREESLQQSFNHKQVVARLEQEKTKWFIQPSPQATAAFVAEMICPRVLTSFSDALFCCHFVQLLIRLKTPGFQLLDFYNNWTIMLTQCIRCCSEREAQIFGIFLREMMSYVLHLRKDEQAYNTAKEDNPCFHRHYSPGGKDPAAPVWADLSDFRKGHAKWEGRIFKAMKAGLESEEWMEKRNALLMLSQSHESFPVVEKYARAILAVVEIMRDKEEYTDLKTLANSLMVKLKTQKDKWVDKIPLAQGERGSGRTEDSSRRPASGGPKSGLAPAQADGKEGGVVNVDAAGGERRSDGTAAKDGKDAKDGREHKDHKDGKDKDGKHKDGKDRGEAKRDSKDARSVGGGEKDSKRPHAKEATDKGRAEKERSDGRSGGDKPGTVVPRGSVVADKDALAGDRKRSGDTRGGERGAVGHDERADKRRRTDRDGGHASAAPGSPRNRGYSGSGPRNQLQPAPEAQNSQYRHSGGAQSYGSEYRSGRSGGGGYAQAGGGGGGHGHRGDMSYRRGR